MPAAPTVTLTLVISDWEIEFPLRNKEKIKVIKKGEIRSFDAESYYAGIGKVRGEVLKIRQAGPGEDTIDEIIEEIESLIDKDPNLGGGDEMVKEIIKEDTRVRIGLFDTIVVKTQIGRGMILPKLRPGDILTAENENVIFDIYVIFPGKERQWDYSLEGKGTFWVDVEVTQDFVYLYNQLFLGEIYEISDEELIDFIEANNLDYDVDDPKDLERARRDLTDDLVEMRFEDLKYEFQV